MIDQLDEAQLRTKSSSASSEASTSSPLAAIGYPRDMVLLFGSYGIYDLEDLSGLNVQTSHIPAVVSFMEIQRSEVGQDQRTTTGSACQVYRSVA